MAHKKNDEKVIYVGDSRVRKKTNRPAPTDYTAYPGKSEAFVPNFLLKEWMVGVVVLVGFMVLVLSQPAPLGYPADPNNTLFIPMPDWYFLFMYQLLKYPYTSEQFTVIGTIAIPGLAFGALMLAPFLDRGPERRFYRRPIASALMFTALIAIVYLTAVSWSNYQSELEAKGITPEHLLKWEDVMAGKETPPPNAVAQEVPIVAEDDPGYAIYQKATCINCHGDTLKGVGPMPALRGIGDTHDKAALLDIIHNGYKSMQPQYNDLIASGLTDEEIDTLADWLSRQKAE